MRENGHLDYGLRRAVALGMDPIRAVQMVSINPARYFGLNGYGAIGPGFKANCFLVDDLKNFTIHEVFLNGLPLDEHDFESGNGLPVRSSMNVGSGKNRVIGTSHGQLLTENLVMEPLLKDGIPIADPARDICKLTVIERHRATG
ncbi:Adenine deaminase like protein, partial [Aduncisulcus paluster]